MAAGTNAGFVNINSDLGESFGPWVMGNDAEVLKIVRSANVACGFHASDPTVMVDTVKLCLQNGVSIGAHPGFADLQGFATAAQYNDAFRVWPSRYAVRAGFAWGLDYLLMPLYATAFFYSGILAREAFAPRGGPLARLLTALSMVPALGALLAAAGCLWSLARYGRIV